MSTIVPDHLLDSTEWSRLDLEPHLRCELAEGVVLFTPRPSPLHQHVSVQVALLLEARLGSDSVALVGVEIGLRVGTRATHRAPDVTVTTQDVLLANRPWMRPADALMVVEVVSPGSVNIDRVLKVHEYQSAGIPAYLVVDLESRELIGFQLDSGAYVSHVGDRVSLLVDGTEVTIGWADLDLG